MVTLDSLERIALIQIGKSSKNAVKILLERTVPSMIIEKIYWNGTGLFTAALASGCTVKRIPKKLKSTIQASVREILRSSDSARNCKAYNVSVVVKPHCTNTFHNIREDG